MKVEVVGKLRGKSKQGNEYIIVDCLSDYKGDNCSGKRTERVFLSVADYDFDEILVGEEYNIDRDNRGYVIGFDPVF